MTNRENFGSKIGAVLAAAGSAVGLGNIWRFPIETGRNGGAAFIIIYIACILLIGLPVMLSEFMIGRHTQANTARAYQKLAPGTQWKWVGRLGVFSGFFIMCYYCVVAGWTIEYAMLALTNQFAGKTPHDFPKIFNEFVANPWMPIIWLIVFVVMTHFVIVKGVTKGIERWSKILMPVLFGLVVVLVVCSVTSPGAKTGLEFLLKPDFSKITGKTVLSAMGQAFYSLSLGMGCLCTYASYFDKKTSLGKTALQVASIDTMIALMAGFIIFPAASSAGYHLAPKDVGASLLFITLPNVFQQAFSGIPMLGNVVALMFYALLSMAALTSTISIHEIATVFFHEELHLSRRAAATIVSAICGVFAVVCALSVGAVPGLRLFGLSAMDFGDTLTSQYLLPIGSFFTCLFVGWVVPKAVVFDELTNSGTVSLRIYRLWLFAVRVVCPIAILLIFGHQLQLF